MNSAMSIAILPWRPIFIFIFCDPRGNPNTWSIMLSKPNLKEVSLYIYILLVFHAIIDIATHPLYNPFKFMWSCHSPIINCTPPVLTTASPISFGRFVVCLFPFSHFTIVLVFFFGIFPWPIIPRLHHSAEPGWHLVMRTSDKPSHFMRQTWCSVKNGILTALFSMLNSYFNYVL